MKKLFPQTDEFFIGYIASMPRATASFLKKIIFSTLSILLIVATIVVVSQKEFTTNEFEYGINTSLSGILIKSPIPHLRIFLGQNYKGEALFQSVLLVGPGKHGADVQLNSFSSGDSITLNGFLIYGDGKALLQVNSCNPISSKERKTTNYQSTERHIPDARYISVSGEITDPKCYFGVMKPGEGKAHRSCAIRCISGGIPPVLKSNSSDYFLLVDENMKTINSEVLPIVGDQVSFRGEVVELDDWRILKVNRNELKALTKAARHKKTAIAMEAGMTFCSH